MARTTVHRREIISNGRCGQVSLFCCGFEMSCESGHQIQNDAVEIENHQLQSMTEELHEARPLKLSWAAVRYNPETSR